MLVGPQGVVVLVRGDLLHIHLCNHVFTDIYDGKGYLALNGVLVFQRRDLLYICYHIHLLVYFVHKYTHIYDGICLLVFKFEVLFERVRFIQFPSPSPELCSKT